MAYRRRRRTARRSYSGRYASRYARPVRRRRTSRRRTARTSRIVIQVVGGGSTVPASPVALGFKSARPVRARY